PMAAAGPSGRRSASPSRVVVAQVTDSLHAIAPAASSEGGVVSEELLQRSIRASLQLAEDLSALVRELNLGLAEIFSQTDQLHSDRDEPGGKAEAVQRIRAETLRLKALIQQIGQPAGSRSGP